jgi:diacylglycerol kinase (ATP)
MRAVVIHNPGAGDEVISKKALEDALMKEGCRVVYGCAKTKDLRRALREIPADVIVVSGGDGTLRKVFCQLAGMAVPPVLILARGTANNIALSLDLDLDWKARVANLRSFTPCPFYFGRVEHADGEDFFFESIGIGIFADYLRMTEQAPEVAEAIAGRDDGDGKDFSKDYRARARLAGLASPVDLKVEMEKRAAEHSAPLLWLEVLNSALFGPRMRFLKKDDPQQSQRFALICVSDVHRADLLSWLGREGEGDIHESGATAEFAPNLVIRGRWRTFHVDDEYRDVDETQETVLRISRCERPIMILR